MRAVEPEPCVTTIRNGVVVFDFTIVEIVPLDVVIYDIGDGVPDAPVATIIVDEEAAVVPMPDALGATVTRAPEMGPRGDEISTDNRTEEADVLVANGDTLTKSPMGAVGMALAEVHQASIDPMAPFEGL